MTIIFRWLVYFLDKILGYKAIRGQKNYQQTDVFKSGVSTNRGPSKTRPDKKQAEEQ